MGPDAASEAATLCRAFRLFPPACPALPLFFGLILIDSDVKTPAGSSSVSDPMSPPAPYRASRAAVSSEDETDETLCFRRTRFRLGAWLPGSGRDEYDDGRRTVVGGERDSKADAGGGSGEGVAMADEAEDDGSGERSPLGRPATRQAVSIRPRSI